jgi:hypothetical protein
MSGRIIAFWKLRLVSSPFAHISCSPDENNCTRVCANRQHLEDISMSFLRRFSATGENVFKSVRPSAVFKHL